MATHMLRFFRLMIRFRREHPVLRRRGFFQQNSGIVWHGEEENRPDWSEGAQWLAFLLDGHQAKRPDGTPDDDIYVLVNASSDWRHFAVPHRNAEWRKVIDTSRPSPEDIFESIEQAPDIGYRHDRFAVEPRSLVVLVNGRG